MCYIPSLETQRKSARLGENFCCAISSDGVWQHAAAIAHGYWGWCLPQSAPQKLSPLLENIMNRDRNNYKFAPSYNTNISQYMIYTCMCYCLCK